MFHSLFPSVSVMGLTMVFAGASLSADKDLAKESAANLQTASTKMTPELKKDMADMYQKMADCMRTAKSLDECRHEAMTNCPVVKKTGHCPINDGMGSGMGKRMKHSMESMKNTDMSTMK